MDDLTDILFELLEENEVEYMEPSDLITYEEVENEPMTMEKYHSIPYEKNVNNYRLPPDVTVQEMKRILSRGDRSPHSEETKYRISIANKGNTITDETKKKISKAMKGRKLSDEHRENISLSIRGKKRRPMSEETKKKISEAKKRANRG